MILNDMKLYSIYNIYIFNCCLLHMLTSTNQYLQKLQHSAILYRCSLRASRKWLYLYLKNTEIPRNIPKPQNKSPLNPRNHHKTHGHLVKKNMFHPARPVSQKRLEPANHLSYKTRCIRLDHDGEEH